MALNNNQCAAVINEAVAQSTGKEIAQLDLTQIIDTGNDSSIVGEKETFTKSLLAVLVKNWFTDSSYRSQYNDPFFISSEEFGAIVQTIHMEYVDAQDSHAWNDFSPSSTGQRKQVGVYDVYVPVIHATVFGLSQSWEIPISITDEQYDVSFHNESELVTFINYIHEMVNNSIVLHLECMNEQNRNNFIGEKIAYATGSDPEGVHVINLVDLYREETGSTLSTAKAFMKDEAAMRFAASKIDLYSDYMTKMSKNFNKSKYDRFTPKDRQVCLVLSDFDKRMRSVAMANTFNPEFITLPNYSTVAAWQSTGNYSFDEVSAINVKTSTGAEVEADGIVAFLADKYACLHTIKKRRVAVHRADPEALSTYFHQFRDQYCNDLTQNALVFVVRDHQE